MGRPLNKKYFGNKNTPFTDFQGSTAPDSGIGGRVASVTLGDLGAYTTRPTVTFSASTLVGGVTATGTVTSEASTVTVVAGGTGYDVGDLIGVVGTEIIARIASVDDDPTEGVVLTLDFGTGSDRSTVEALPADVTALATTVITGQGDDGLTVDVTFRAKAVVITNAGQGYVTAADAAPTFTQSVTGTTVLSTVSNSRAIKAFAFLTGGSRLSADIIKQDNKIQYKVENATGVAVVQLVNSEANAAGEMDITAYDSDANEYWVKKLTARKAVITRKSSGDGQFASGTSVPWTFDSAVEDYSVKIDNA
jgi:hypothetical protein